MLGVSKESIHLSGEPPPVLIGRYPPMPSEHTSLQCPLHSKQFLGFTSQLHCHTGSVQSGSQISLQRGRDLRDRVAGIRECHLQLRTGGGLPSWRRLSEVGQFHMHPKLPPPPFFFFFGVVNIVQILSWGMGFATQI